MTILPLSGSSKFIFIGSITNKTLEIIFFSFGDDSGITFRCRYSRSVSVSQDITVIDTPSDAVEGTGDFSYSMSIAVGGPGGNTDVTITPNHSFAQIAPR